MLIEQMPMARVVFAKRGRARFTSHLDVMRMFTRAFKRSGLPLWHTQGFNPHLYMMFPLPLALGYESVCETLDIRLTRELPLDEVTQRLNAALPPGFEALSAAPPVMDPKEIAFAEYAVELKYTQGDAKFLEQKLAGFMALPVIEAQKKTKKGDKTLDLKPLSELIHTEARDDTLALGLKIAAGLTLNVNPTLLLHVFYAWTDREPDGVKITRTRILTADNRDFI